MSAQPLQQRFQDESVLCGRQGLLRLPFLLRQPPYQIKRKTGRLPTIALLAKEYGRNRATRNNILDVLEGIFGPQVKMIRGLSRALLGKYWDKCSRPGGRGKGRVATNAAGITFCKYDYPEGHVRRSKAMAWYLQGLEAAYVHALTVISRNYDYEVFANEHDGCVTIGTIPEKAKKEARALSGFHEAELVEKPFEGASAVQTFADKADITVPAGLE